MNHASAAHVQPLDVREAVEDVLQRHRQGHHFEAMPRRLADDPLQQGGRPDLDRDGADEEPAGPEDAVYTIEESFLLPGAEIIQHFQGGYQIGFPGGQILRQKVGLIRYPWLSIQLIQF